MLFLSCQDVSLEVRPLKDVYKPQMPGVRKHNSRGSVRNPGEPGKSNMLRIQCSATTPMPMRQIQSDRPFIVLFYFHEIKFIANVCIDPSSWKYHREKLHSRGLSNCAAVVSERHVWASLCPLYLSGREARRHSLSLQRYHTDSGMLSYQNMNHMKPRVWGALHLADSSQRVRPLVMGFAIGSAV